MAFPVVARCGARLGRHSASQDRRGASARPKLERAPGLGDRKTLAPAKTTRRPGAAITLRILVAFSLRERPGSGSLTRRWPRSIPNRGSDPQSRLPKWGPRDHIISAAPVSSGRVETVLALGTRGALSWPRRLFRLAPHAWGGREPSARPPSSGPAPSPQPRRCSPRPRVLARASSMALREGGCQAVSVNLVRRIWDLRPGSAGRR